MRDYTYWFARGYFDGRTYGNQEMELTPELRDELHAIYADVARHAYKNGYDKGVSDYCDIDLEVESDPYHAWDVAADEVLV